MIPPIFINVRVHWVLIPLPVVLLWPLLALLWIVTCLVISVALLSTGGDPLAIGRIWPTSWRLICAMRGTRVDIEQPDVRVQVIIV
ncbi:MAG: hypothetical protein C5B49_01555 [Bdellovibrio sp.]|nr:MAG: hypothetical protein C5B49_01555 [Bdellovibrio sp.]